MTNSNYLNTKAQDTADNDINYICGFSNYDNENYDISQMVEMFRIAPTKTVTGNTVKIEVTIPSNVGVCPSNTITAISSDQKTLTLSDATLFLPKERVLIDILPSNNQFKIMSKSSNNITLDRPVGTSSVVGSSIKVMISKIAVVKSTSSDPNEGTILEMFDKVFYKNSGTSPMPITMKLTIQ